MMVTAASSGPFTQSSSLSGGTRDYSVGPGVGARLTTVQVASACSVACCSPGVAETCGGAGFSVVEASITGGDSTISADGSPGVSVTALEQATRNTDKITNNAIILLNMFSRFNQNFIKSPNFTNESGRED